jgi:hypothetical protein
MFEKTFILNFNKSASIYKEEEKLEAGTSWRWNAYDECDEWRRRYLL